MKKTFIERLTVEQIMEFLKAELPTNSAIRLTRKSDAIEVTVVTNHRFESFFNLKEYGIKGELLESKWIKYLYCIFEEEYKEAYLNHCAQIFN